MHNSCKTVCRPVCLSEFPGPILCCNMQMRSCLHTFYYFCRRAKSKQCANKAKWKQKCNANKPKQSHRFLANCTVNLCKQMKKKLGKICAHEHTLYTCIMHGQFANSCSVHFPYVFGRCAEQHKLATTHLFVTS